MDEERLKDPSRLERSEEPLPASDEKMAQHTASLRVDIAETRAQMSETIDAIEERLRPSSIVANATERVKAATTERARAMADSAEGMARDVVDRTRDTARDVMNRTRDTAGEVADRTRDVAGSLIDTIRNNPFPAALIGIGLAWWAFSRMQSDKTSWDSIRGEAPQDYFDDDATYNDETDEFDGGFRRGNGADSARTDGPGLGRKMADSASSFAHSASDYAGQTGRAISRTGRRASNRVGQIMTDNPLLVGAGALLVGAAFGLAVPETDRENEWMGDARNTFVKRAQRAAGDAANRIKKTANEVADAAESVAQSVTGKS